MKIIFMGTPQFAAYQLTYLLDKGVQVLAAVTMPDKPMGRGMKLGHSAVKEAALNRGIPVLQPEKLRDEAFLQELQSFNADVFVVVAFRMLPKLVWAMPPKGTLNLHASLLPQYRGAAPINWAIINGETETGVTTFLIQEEIDTGDVLMSERVTVEPSDNAGTLHDKLMTTGAELILATLNSLEQGGVVPIPQAQIAANELKVAPKLFKEHGLINWNESAEKINNLIRGLSPYPAAHTVLQLEGDKKLNLKIFEALPLPDTLKVGEVESDGKKYFHIGTGKGSLALTDIQLEGKKRMDIRSFLMGFDVGSVKSML